MTVAAVFRVRCATDRSRPGFATRAKSTVYPLAIAAAESYPQAVDTRENRVPFLFKPQGFGNLLLSRAQGVVHEAREHFMQIFDFHAAQAGGSSEAVPLYWWQGWTGRWYVATISTITDFRCAEPGLYIVARREADGCRTPLVIGWASNVEEDLRGLRAADFADACAAGANEIHVHLLDHPTQGRESVGKDLARAWALPLASLHPFTANANPPVRLPRSQT